SSESIATESLGSFVAYVILPYPAPVVSDSDSVEPSFNSKPFLDRVSPTTDPDDEPLGSSDTIDASSSTDESLQAHAVPTIAP
ncbi:hypothetical protein Tco_0619066, partial [Tanacetum coccineum]